MSVQFATVRIQSLCPSQKRAVLAAVQGQHHGNKPSQHTYSIYAWMCCLVGWLADDRRMAILYYVEYQCISDFTSIHLGESKPTPYDMRWDCGCILGCLPSGHEVSARRATAFVLIDSGSSGAGWITSYTNLLDINHQYQTRAMYRCSVPVVMINWWF